MSQTHLTPALRELLTTLDEVSEGRSSLFDGDRRSLVADLDLCLTRAGKHLGAFTSPTLRRLRTGEIAKLQATLSTAADCRRLAGVVRDVLWQLRTDGAVEAAWLDVVAAASDGSVAIDSCVLAGDQLRELIGMRGHSWWYLSSRISDQVRAGDLDAACQAALAPAVDDATVAWVAFGNADLDRGYCRVGQVQFFTHKLPLDVIRDGCAALSGWPDFEPATELTDDVIAAEFPDVKDQEHYVWARVELSGPRAHAPTGGRTQPPLDWAREFAQGVVEAAAFSNGGTEWKLLGGGYFFTAKGPAGGTMWVSEDTGPESFFGHPLDEPTSQSLEGLPGAFADALARDEPAARFAVDELRWHRTVRLGGDPAGRLALHVRGFERQWVTGPSGKYRTWEEPVRRYLRDAWANTSIQADISAAGHFIHRAGNEPGATQRMMDASAEVFQMGRRSSFSISYPDVVKAAPQLSADFAGGSLQRRCLNEVARMMRDGDAIRDALDRSAQCFDRLLNRAVRQRNRIIHGGGVEPDIAAGVEPFLRQLSAWLVSESIDAACKAQSVEHVLEKLRASGEERYEHLRDSPTDAFFGPIA